MINRLNLNGQFYRLLVVISSIAFLHSCAGRNTAYRPKWIKNPAQICIERPEEMGMANIVGVNVSIRDFQTIRLVGGQAACAYVSAGDYFVYGHSYDPYNRGDPNPQALKSKTLRLDIKEGEKINLVICMGFAASSWVLKYADQTGGDECQVEQEMQEMKNLGKQK